MHLRSQKEIRKKQFSYPRMPSEIHKESEENRRGGRATYTATKISDRPLHVHQEAVRSPTSSCTLLVNGFMPS